MLQIFQYQKTGELLIEALPDPALRQGGVLVRTQISLVSAGTEKSSVETAQASLIGKAKKRPDLVKQVQENIRREGLSATWLKVKTRLDNYAQLGYSSAGVVIESSVDEFKPGDRVACAGSGYASHAEVVFVPKNLTARLPDSVTFEEAAFTTLGTIALQGVRQADVRIGEQVVVIGLGLIGLLTVQLLKANGCRVMGLDVHDRNFETARQLGCDDCALSHWDSLPSVESFTCGHGADAVILTAATTSNEPVELALQMARKRATVVVVGAVGMNIPRNPFYEKEIEFRISCSYGPGRYDADYEERGIDYPPAFVRWTEQRNMQAFIDLLAMGKVNVRRLMTHTFSIQEALKAYDLITGKVKEHYLGILISYPQRAGQGKEVSIQVHPPDAGSDRPTIGFIGAGNFAQSYLLPPLLKKKVVLKGVKTASPLKAKSAAKKFNFEFCTSDADEVLKRADAVFITTRHDSHADYVVQAFKAGVHVFVEKPLAVTESQLVEIIKTYREYAAPVGHSLMVGFNRRFSRPMLDIKEFFSSVREPLQMTVRVNAGFLPKDHWTQAAEQGGRIIGEACHFIDAMSFLTGSRPVSVYAESITSDNVQMTDADNCTIVVKYSNGAIGTLIYTASGDKSLEKEYYEIFGGGYAVILNNFTSAAFFANGKKQQRKYNGGKGHAEEIDVFLKTIRGEQPPAISFESLVDTTVATFAAVDSLKSKRPIVLRWPEEN